jgi:hypothetical protein
MIEPKPGTVGTLLRADELYGSFLDAKSPDLKKRRSSLVKAEALLTVFRDELQERYISEEPLSVSIEPLVKAIRHLQEIVGNYGRDYELWLTQGAELTDALVKRANEIEL